MKHWLVFLLICIVLFTSQVGATSSNCRGATEASKKKTVVLFNHEDAELLDTTTTHKRHSVPSKHTHVRNAKTTRSIKHAQRKAAHHLRSTKLFNRIAHRKISSFKKPSGKKKHVSNIKQKVATIRNNIPTPKIRGKIDLFATQKKSSAQPKVEVKKTIQAPTPTPVPVTTPAVPIAPAAVVPVVQNEDRNSRLAKKVYSEAAKKIISESLASFNGVLGPSTENINNGKPTKYTSYRSGPVNKKQRLQTVNIDAGNDRNSLQAYKEIAPTSGEEQFNRPNEYFGPPTKCIACQVDCLKVYSALGGALFGSCEGDQRYYYYGCEHVAPCFSPKTAPDAQIEGMVGICEIRNRCKFVSEWQLVGENQTTTDIVIGKLRASE